MNTFITLAIVLIALSFVYTWGAAASRRVASQTGEKLHSRPPYYGLYLVLWCAIPAAIIFIVYSLITPTIETVIIQSYFPQEVLNDAAELANQTRQVESIAGGFGMFGEPAPYQVQAAAALNNVEWIGKMALVALIAVAAVAGTLVARTRISPEFRARNRIETAIEMLLITCSAIAVLTTVGIVLSVLGEAVRFFTFVNPIDFFLGTSWNPRFSTTGHGGQGDFGLLPLLWGTLMITIIAMIVAVPIGLMAAVYLSEYAGPKFRFVAKPMLEVLAGIPTIVYGIFAAFTVGPFLSTMGDAVGLDINATSAFTAGIVMGIMIIPFVSSLSDDIISQVPQSLRDGSYGLGATRSETIRRVILPAALPGIVGAFLLAVSRAIGETMIVVLAAGNSPVLTANPFEAVSTVTVTIVNQLTGDTDFASPQSLVAFALGLTLFVITLCLNVVAIYIVRKYREQYE